MCFEHTPEGPRWFLRSSGETVALTVARCVLRADGVSPCADGLFENITPQTFVIA